MDLDVTRIAEFELGAAVESMEEAQSEEELNCYYNDAVAILESVYQSLVAKFEQS